MLLDELLSNDFWFLKEFLEAVENPKHQLSSHDKHALGVHVVLHPMRILIFVLYHGKRLSTSAMLVEAL